MNWGNRLLLVFLVFAIFMATMVYRAMHTSVQLVSADYYGEEIRYQEKIDGAANAATVGNIAVSRTQSDIVVSLPPALSGAALTGDAWFYCRTQSGSDRKYKIESMNGGKAFPLRDLAKASYELRLQLTANGKPYFYKTDIDLR